MNEIKPCPSCKQQCELAHTVTYWVNCLCCGYEGPLSDSEAEAIRLHNLIPRIPEPAIELDAPAIHTGIFARIWAQGFNACRDKMIEAAQEKHDETHPA